MKNKKVILVEGVNPQAIKKLEASGFDVHIQNSSITEKKLIEFAPICVGIRSRTQLGSAFFSESQNTLCVGAFCIGVDQIDLKAASKNGVAIFNSPYSNTRSVAELVIANMVNLSRKIVYFNQYAHKGQWKKTSKQSYEVRGKTIGIIGYGHIGSQVSVLAESIGLSVFYYDIEKKLSLGNAKSVDSLDALLSQCDFITLHVPHTPKTQNMITKKQLQKMKKGSYLINTSRGSTIQISDLYDALSEGHLAGAAIDVFPKEPASNQDVFKTKLQDLDNVILTPHIGGSTEEAQMGIAEDVSSCLAQFLLHGDSSGSVNFPNLKPTVKLEDTTRIANVHKNEPGVLTKVNDVISSLGLNILSQNLTTTQDIGYLITDVECLNKEKEDAILNAIQDLKSSVKTRII